MKEMEGRRGSVGKRDRDDRGMMNISTYANECAQIILCKYMAVIFNVDVAI